MSEPAILEMPVLCGAAVGLALLAGVRLLAARRSLAVRVSVTSASALAPAAVVAAFGFRAPAVASVGVVCGAAAGSELIGSEAVRARVAAILRRLGRPGVQAAVLSAGGSALLVGALARYEVAVGAEYDADLESLSKVTLRPSLAPVTAVAVATDAGRPIKLLKPEAGGRPAAEATAAERHTLSNMAFADRLIRIEPASDTCNCYGWVFAGGRYWIGPEDVETILADNGYHPVSDPRPGDVVVYRDGGQPTHAGVVRTGGAGVPLLVESKWGWMGVFLHRPEDTQYGRQFAFYRGPRATHVVAGLGAPPTAGGDTRAAAWAAPFGTVGH